MVLPRLIHPVNVTIETIDKARTLYDPMTRSVIGQPLRTSVTIKAQLNNRRHDQVTMDPGGRETDGDGYILARLRDLERAGVTIEIGDKITKLGRRDVAYFITRKEFKAGYSDQDGHTLVRFFYNDRSPSK
jgi:hypothetical protein